MHSPSRMFFSVMTVQSADGMKIIIVLNEKAHEFVVYLISALCLYGLFSRYFSLFGI